MENRKRGRQILFRVSEEELKIISERMKLAEIQNRETYIRKMVLCGYILNIDFSDLRKMIVLLGNTANNLNQIAKRVNTSNNIYKDDIKELQGNYNELLKTSKTILDRLLKI